MSRPELRVSRLLFAVLVCLASVAGACQFLVTLESKASPGVDATVADAAPDGPDPEADAHPACRKIPPPSPPPSGAPSLGTLTFAAVHWDFRQTDAGNVCPIIGYDFDNIDTAPPRPCLENRACKQRPGPLAADPCDQARGADNALIRLLEAVEIVPVVGDLVKKFSALRILQTGAVNLLLDLRDYNGTANDDDVSIALYATAGYQLADAGIDLDAAAAANDAAAYIGPIYPVPDADSTGALSFGQLVELPQVWDGGQSDFRWVVDERSVQTSGAGSGVFVPRQSVRGYVSNWVLVADALGEGIFPLGLPGVSGLPYRQGNLTAFLQKQPDGSFLLTHGRLSARFASQGLLSAVGAGRNPGANTSGQLCDPKNSLDYLSLYRPFVCRSLDLPQVDAGNDPAVPCQEFSATMVFASVPGDFARSKAPGKAEQLVTGQSLLGDGVPCLDADSGTTWCDDCDWAGPRTCGPK